MCSKDDGSQVNLPHRTPPQKKQKNKEKTKTKNDVLGGNSPVNVASSIVRLMSTTHNINCYLH